MKAFLKGLCLLWLLLKNANRNNHVYTPCKSVRPTEVMFVGIESCMHHKLKVVFCKGSLLL